MSTLEILWVTYLISVIPMYLAILHYIRKFKDITYRDLIASFITAWIPFLNIYALLVVSDCSDRVVFKKY